ncbi:MAG: LysR family transcriptional regulator, partial [Clostridia bacterium]|nr:LysR family transcriptional regulator [Deltaproteobacteria bacterium]
MDLNALRTLIVLVEERSTTKAARRLFVSQPTVSGTLAK